MDNENNTPVVDGEGTEAPTEAPAEVTEAPAEATEAAPEEPAA